VLKKPQIIAMFYNNKAAQFMIEKDYDHAFAYLKAAILTDPNSSESWNNLAVLYRSVKHFDLAEDAYKLALQLDPEST
jgi:Tfp pilus assembly protein PilF